MSVEVQGLANVEIREHNRAVILSTLTEEGPMARTDLAARVGLVHGAISALVGGLIEEGLVQATSEQSRTGRRGRPKEQLEIDGRSLAMIAVQVLFREYQTLMTDLAGREVYRNWTRLGSLPPLDADSITSQIASEINQAAESAAAKGMRVAGVRVALPGGVSADGADFVASIDLGWSGDVPTQPTFMEQIGSKIRLPSSVLEPGSVSASASLPVPRGVNDANAAAFAEFTLLRQQPRFNELTDLVYLKGDVGFGGGAIVRGELVEGRRGFAFEPGHIRVDGVQGVCGCGQTGCLALVAGSQALLKGAGLTGFAADFGNRAALDELDRRKNEDDPRAVAALSRALVGVKQALTTSIMLLSPQLVVLSGYLGRYADELRQIADTPLSALGVGGLVGRNAILAGGHGDTATLQGALALARREILGLVAKSTGEPGDR